MHTRTHAHTTVVEATAISFAKQCTPLANAAPSAEAPVAGALSPSLHTHAAGPGKMHA